MLLAEVFLAYDMIRSPSFASDLLLWDQSMSSIMARTDVGISNINMIGYRYGRNKLTKQGALPDSYN
ncbi:MAG: hypothetical protein QMD22_04810 [archaeon]|nr:hypothetical protein [archaeon]